MSARPKAKGSYFDRWQQSRNMQGTFEHMVRAMFAAGLSYSDAVDRFRVCYLAEAVAASETREEAAQLIEVDPNTIWRRLEAAGFSTKKILALPKQLTVGARRKTKEEAHGSN